MINLILTAYQGAILGPIARVLGYIMQGIYWLLEKIGIPNVGIAIIVFTIVIYLLLLPLTIKQQKFSKLSAKMNPEIQAIQAKYKGRKDPDAMQAMNAETQAVYAKYGVNPMGSCVQLLIQMPILFALYRVISAIPAYVTSVKDAFYPLVSELRNQAGSTEFIQSLKSASMYNKQFTNELFVNGDTTYVENTYIDVLNRASKADWNLLIEKFPDLSESIGTTLENLDKFNNFLFINISYSPWETITMEWAADERNYVIIICALMIPLLAAFTQWIGFKLAPNAGNSTGNDDNPMMTSMKTMNNIMPLMSAFFCFTLPAGMGLYWIAGAVIRGIQQIAINKYIDHMDMDKLINKNSKKYEKKVEKRKEFISNLNEKAGTNTRKINNPYTNVPSQPKTKEELEEKMKKSTEYYNKNNKGTQGSLASKANMVKQYNEKNNK